MFNLLCNIDFRPIFITVKGIIFDFSCFITLALGIKGWIRIRTEKPGSRIRKEWFEEGAVHACLKRPRSAQTLVKNAAMSGKTFLRIDDVLMKPRTEET